MDTPFRGRLLLIAGVVAALTLSACSTSGGSASSGPATGTGTPSAPATDSPSTAPVGIDLADSWATAGLLATGSGYAMTLAPTSDPDRFDGHFFHRADDGAVSDQVIISIREIGSTQVEITWPDGSRSGGGLRVEDSAAAEIDLGAGCLAYLTSGGTAEDCRLQPSAPGSASRAPTPAALPARDEAMSFLCSAAVGDLPSVTGPDSDPYATAVLQFALMAVGSELRDADGRYAGATRSAVLRFQRGAGLSVDGLVGPRTWTALQARACHVPDDPASQTASDGAVD